MANTKITSNVIANDAILTANIADDQITSALIADDVALGGNPTTTTQTAGNSTTRIATTAFVSTAISNLVDSSPAALNTLNELAAALGDDANFSTTVTNSIATKVALSGSSQTIADSGTLTLDAATNIVLDADGNEIQFKDGGTHYGKIYGSNSNFYINAVAQDKDIIFVGDDGGSSVTALTLDMSAAGKAIFNAGADFADSVSVTHTQTNFAPEITINNTNNANGATGAIRFVTENESTGLIIGKHSSGFSEPDLAFVYNELNTALQFGTNNVEHMRIGADGFIEMNASRSEYGLSLKSAGTRSGLVLVKPATSTVMGSVLLLTDESFRLGTANNYHIQMYQDGSTKIVNGLELMDGDLKVAAGHGIDFSSTGEGTTTGANMASELLDDYEEGSWTPTLGGGGTITVNTATYTKIGRYVHAYCYVFINPPSNGTSFSIFGLPYNAVNNSNFYPAGSLGYSQAKDLNNLHDPLVHYNNNYIYFHFNDGSSSGVVPNSKMYQGSQYGLILNVQYEV